MKKGENKIKFILVKNLSIFIFLVGTFIVSSAYVPKFTGAFTGFSSQVSTNWLLIGITMFITGFILTTLLTKYTTRPIWLNEDGSLAKLTWKPIDKKEKFSEDSFIKNYEKFKKIEEAEKSEYSQEILGNKRLESISDSEFKRIKRRFNEEVIQEDLFDYLVGNTPNISSIASQISPEELERFLLNKNPNALFSTYKLDEPKKGDPREKETKIYNFITELNRTYHNEKNQMEEIGEERYSLLKLNNLLSDPYRRAFVQFASGSRLGDYSKIARGLVKHYASKFLEAAKRFGGSFGLIPYLSKNINRARELDVNQRAEMKNLEETVEKVIANQGPGSTSEETAKIYNEADELKKAISEKYQNAGTDAKYLFKGLGDLGYKSSIKLHEEKQARAAYEERQKRKAA